MTTDAASLDTPHVPPEEDRTKLKFCALEANDFILIKVVRRKKDQPTMGQDMTAFYGYGIVSSVDSKGECKTYIAASGAERVAEGMAASWGLPARILGDRSGEFRDAIIERAGVPFMTFSDARAFVMPFVDKSRIQPDGSFS